MDVTAVIPTTGRPSLRAAVVSVIEQRGIEAGALVVADLPSADADSLDLAGLPEDRVTILCTGGGAGGAGARSLGTHATATPWVAYLDDDDEWMPEKSARQLEATRRSSTPTLVSCRIVSASEVGERVGPRDVYAGGDVADYLFRKRRLAVDRNLLHTSTLFLPTKLAIEVDWRQLARHQDWDFVVRCATVPGVQIVQIPDPLVRVHAGSEGSISGSAAWSASLAWARDFKGVWTESTYADFLTGQPLRYALQARDRAGVREVVRELHGVGFPSLRACMLAGGGLLTRAQLVEAMHSPTRALHLRKEHTAAAGVDANEATR